MKNSINVFLKIAIVYFSIICLASCSSLHFKYGALNHAAAVDGIYNSNTTFIEVPANVKIDTLNYFQLNRKLRTDFNFRYDYAQYALSQPISFDWNNRTLGNRYNFYNPYYSRTQMWNDWVWGYGWYTPHRWSPFGYDRWGYNNYGYGMGWSYSWNNRRWSSNSWNNPYGWNNYYGWGNGYNRYRNTNVSYHSGRRGRIAQTGTVGNTLSNKVITKTEKRKPRINNTNNDQIIRHNSRRIIKPESSNNGGRSRIRQNIPSKPVRVRQPNTVQPRQVRGGSRPPVLQQTRTRSQPNVQRRNGSSRRKN